MTKVTMKELLEAGLHFGHRTSRWNPKMRPYIYGARNGIHIINLRETMKLLRKTLEFVTNLAGAGESVLFVGTKRQAKPVVESHAARANMPYVSHRWLGGMLTNFQTVKQSIKKLETVEDSLSIGKVERLPKKEVLKLEKYRNKLLRNLGGIRKMDGKPGAVFVIDPSKEHIAVKEAKKLGVKVVALIDTNCAPELIDYMIPGNDDSIRSISLITSLIADACLEGQELYKERLKNDYQSGGSNGAVGSKPNIKRERKVKKIGHKKEVIFKKTKIEPSDTPAKSEAPTESKE